MNPSFFTNKKFLSIAAACLLIGGITMSFQNMSFGPIDKIDTLTDLQDTIPATKANDDHGKMDIKDFDLLIQNMDSEMLKVQKEVSNINMEKLHEQVAASLNSVDFDKIRIELDKAMKQIDFAKIEAGVKTAMKEIDWDRISSDAKKSLQDARREIDKINMDEVKREMQNAKAEIEKSKDELKKINVDAIMKNASAGIAKAKEELRLTKEMFNQMEKDGLIDQAAGFTIEFKDKALFINGRKQPEAVTHKYQSYIKGDSFKITIAPKKD